MRSLKVRPFAAVAFGELSVGQQRMVLLARAMVKSPPLLLLDEPCQGLDAANRQILLQALERIGRARETSLVYVTHHAEDLPACITHLLQLEAGKVRYQGLNV
jgi:molybdate transport system ATP-binding protein